MNNQQEGTGFEFLLRLGNNIICQRYFSVRDANKKKFNSLEIYDYVNDLVAEISRDLKRENFLYMTNPNQNYDSVNGENETLKKDHYTLELKHFNRSFHSRIFEASVYHPKVRYSVDIRPKMREIIADLVSILSSDSENEKYLKYKLA